MNDLDKIDKKLVTKDFSLSSLRDCNVCGDKQDQLMLIKELDETGEVKNKIWVCENCYEGYNNQ